MVYKQVLNNAYGGVLVDCLTLKETKFGYTVSWRGSSATAISIQGAVLASP